MAKRVKQSVKTTKSDQNDTLADNILSALNKQFKDYPGAFEFLSNANLIKHWVSTGSDILNLNISNRPNGGLGYSSIVEFFGLPGTGKSLLAAHVLYETQKQDGIAVLFDTEGAVGTLEFYESIGLDSAKVIYSKNIRALEDVFAAMESIIEKYIASDSDQRMTIVVDSIMGATTNAELEADYGIDGFATAKSKILSKAMRKLPGLIGNRNILIVFINQLKENLNAVGFGAEKYKTTGGTAISFTSHVRLYLKKGKMIKIGGEEVGHELHVKTVKNRFGPKGKSTVLHVYYESGIDNYGSWLKTLKDCNLITGNAASYKYNVVDPETGELTEEKFTAKAFPKLLSDNPDLKAEMYDKLCECLIMKYKVGENFSFDEVELTDD